MFHLSKIKDSYVPYNYINLHRVFHPIELVSSMSLRIPHVSLESSRELLGTNIILVCLSISLLAHPRDWIQLDCDCKMRSLF